MRLFVAVHIPEELKEQLTGLQDTLKKAIVDVKWERAEKFHLTMKFLGEVPEENAGGVADAVARACAGMAPFKAVLGGVGGFPTANRPRVVWAGITEGSGELISLAERVDRELEPLGFPKEKRPFSAHLTLGRVRSPQNLSALVKKMASCANVELGAFTVRSVEIMISVLGRGGSTYSCLRSISI